MSFKVQDYIGMRFGKLVIIKDGGNDAKLGRMAVVICDCGNTKIYSLADLKIGRKKSCGCIRKSLMNQSLLKYDGFKPEDHIGLTFGKLTILEIVESGKHRNAQCLAICECGVTKIFTLGHLKAGHTTSCGCHRRKMVSISSTTHGLSKHPLCSIWRGIKSRCYNPKMDNYKWYGGIGVIMCDLWLNSFQSFYDWAIENGWEKGLEIDRFPDNKGNYSPENCRITTHKKNMNNTSLNRMLNVDGEIMTLKEASEKFNQNYDMLKWRLQEGWDDHLACHTPSRKT